MHFTKYSAHTTRDEFSALTVFTCPDYKPVRGKAANDRVIEVDVYFQIAGEYQDLPDKRTVLLSEFECLKDSAAFWLLNSDGTFTRVVPTSQKV